MQAGGPFSHQPTRRAATGTAGVNVVRGLMLVLHGGGAVFLFGYLHEPYNGAPGAVDGG